MNRKIKIMALVGYLVGGAHIVSAQDWFAKEVRTGAHDPTVFRHESGYVLQTTNNMLLTSTSENALHWKTHDRALAFMPQWLKDATGNQVGDIWAPDLHYFGGEYRSYYSGSAFGKNTSGIGFVATKSIIPGSSGYGWSDKGEVWRSKTSDNYNAIDADVIKDANGKYWMTFGSWWDGIRLIQLDEVTGKQSTSDRTLYRIASRGGGAIEGPALIEHGGQYFLFTAWDVCCKMGTETEDNTYKTAMGRADKVTGPYVDRSGKNLADRGGTILMQRYGRYYGPGGGEPFQDLNRIRFAHHYYDKNANGSPLLQIRDVVFTQDNWAEMGQPFLGRYLSAEAEHGALTNVEISTGSASNGEFVGLINYSDSKIRLPMNIQQAGDYLLRYRYAAGNGDASHNVSINGTAQKVQLPATASWGAFPEKSVVNIPAKLIRGGNFIEVKLGDGFGELDRIDFLRVIRDTLPGNGFENGMRIRLNDKDELAMKDGGWGLFENVITDSIPTGVAEVKVQVKNCSGGRLTLNRGSLTGAEVLSCNLPSSCGASSWSEVTCSALPSLSGVQDWYLKATGNSGEFAVGNIRFIQKTTHNLPKNVSKGQEYKVERDGLNYVVKFSQIGDYLVDVVNSSGKVLQSKSIHNGAEVRLNHLPKVQTYFRIKRLGEI